MNCEDLKKHLLEYMNKNKEIIIETKEVCYYDIDKQYFDYDEICIMSNDFKFNGKLYDCKSTDGYKMINELFDGKLLHYEIKDKKLGEYYNYEIKYTKK
jgi:hypothetical protein